MNLQDFLGEATEYDKKQAVEMKKPKSWLKSVSAFANTVGGVLVFDVTNDDQVIGLDDIKVASEYVSQKIKERISPFPQIVMQLHTMENGKEILTVRVPAGTETPYYYAADGVTEAYIRIGTEEIVLLTLLKEYPEITQDRAAENLGISKRKLQRMMKNLTERGYIERTGSRKSGRWTVLKEE